MANNGISLNMKKTDVSNIDNTELVEAIKEMRQNFTPENQNKVVNLALKATFFVPGYIDKKTELVKGADNRMSFSDKQAVKFLLISNAEKVNFFPAYTDRELLKGFKTDQPYQGFAMKFADLANLTEQTSNIEGFIINPDTEKLPFNRMILEKIKGALKTARENAEAAKAAQGGPNITVSTNENPEE